MNSVNGRRRLIQFATDLQQQAKQHESAEMLKIANKYGNFDVRGGCPKGYEHVRGKSLQGLCDKLRIKYLKAFVGNTGSYPWYPRYDGVVVTAKSATKLRQVVCERETRKSQKLERAMRGLSVLTALFTLNRRAKRCRDLAQHHYRNGNYAFASANRNEKDRIYHLKGQALHYLLADNRLRHAGYHQFENGGWAELLEGDGYRFHRPAPPQSDMVPLIGMIEARTKTRNEPLLSVATAVVNEYLRDKPLVLDFLSDEVVEQSVQVGN